MSARTRALAVFMAAVAGVALTARLGIWQLARAAEKESLQAALLTRGAEPSLSQAELAQGAVEAAAQFHRRVTLQGRWIGGRTVFLDNRPMDGRAGFYVVTPLVLADGDAVLVQRGWVPRDAANRTHVPAIASPEGMVTVQGRIAPSPSRLFELGAEGRGAIRQNLDLDTFAREAGLRLKPLTVQQTDTGASADDGLLRHWPAPTFDVARNYGYAFQWFSFAALITGLYVWFQLVRPRLRRRA